MGNWYDELYDRGGATQEEVDFRRTEGYWQDDLEDYQDSYYSEEED